MLGFKSLFTFKFEFCFMYRSKIELKHKFKITFQKLWERKLFVGKEKCQLKKKTGRKKKTVADENEQKVDKTKKTAGVSIYNILLAFLFCLENCIYVDVKVKVKVQ